MTFTRRTTEARDWGRLQKMERSHMLMDWQNKHSKNGFTIKSNVHVQHKSHQNPNDIHHWGWKIYPKVHTKAQKTLSSLRNTEQKEQHWRYHNTWLQIILQSHSNKSSLALAQTKTNGTEVPEIKSHLIFDKGAKNWRKDSLINKWCWENWLCTCIQKTETRSQSLTCIKINPK
jgi:hypothetical protein